MKNVIIAVAVVLAGTPLFACSKEDPVRWVRLLFAAGCKVPADKVQVQVGTQKKFAIPEGKYYVADFGEEGSVGSKYAMNAALLDGLTLCCYVVSELELPNKPGCTADYVVSCDTPAWGVVAKSDANIAFVYEREHPDGLGPDSWLCERDIPDEPAGIKGIGAGDRVQVKVKAGKTHLLSIPVTFEQLKVNNGLLPLNRDLLDKLLTDEAKKGPQPGTKNVKALIEQKRTLLPSGVTVAVVQ